MLPLSTNVKEAYKCGCDDEQNFIQNLSLFLCTFLRNHGQLIDKNADLHEVLREVCLLLTDHIHSLEASVSRTMSSAGVLSLVKKEAYSKALLSIFSLHLNFATLSYSRNSRKFVACEKYVFSFATYIYFADINTMQAARKRCMPIKVGHLL